MRTYLKTIIAAAGIVIAVFGLLTILIQFTRITIPLTQAGIQTPVLLQSGAQPANSMEVEVNSTQGWQSTGVYIERGITVTLEVIEGEWTGWKGQTVYNGGEGTRYICADNFDPEKCVEPLPYFPSDSLVGKIDDTKFSVGHGLTFVAEQSGSLYLRINDDESGLSDNDGKLRVRISYFSVAIPAATIEPLVVAEAPDIVYEYKDMTVGFIQIGSESAWRSANNASFKETAIALGVNLKFYDSANPRNYQITAFQQFIDDPEVNVIVIIPLEVSGWEELFQKAKDAGKLVILSERRIEAGHEDLYITFVGSDFVEEGRKAGREMCKLLEKNEKKNVWELAGTVGSQAAIDRGTGFRETAGKCGIVVTNSQTANWNTIEGQQITEVWLKESKDVQGIFAQNDEMGLGAIEALKKTGLVPAVDVKIISIDATSAAFQAMLKGDLNVTVEYNPLLAPQIYEAALAALNGESLPKWIPTKESVFFMDDPNLEEIAAGRKY